MILFSISSMFLNLNWHSWLKLSNRLTLFDSKGCSLWWWLEFLITIKTRSRIGNGIVSSKQKYMKDLFFLVQFHTIFKRMFNFEKSCNKDTFLPNRTFYNTKKLIYLLSNFNNFYLSSIGIYFNLKKGRVKLNRKLSLNFQTNLLMNFSITAI